MTAASDRFAMGTRLRVTRISNGKSVVVRVTDRVRRRKTDLDLCRQAAAELGMISDGVAKVREEKLKP